jgi:hypothetical protein
MNERLCRENSLLVHAEGKSHRSCLRRVLPMRSMHSQPVTVRCVNNRRNPKRHLRWHCDSASAVCLRLRHYARQCDEWKHCDGSKRAWAGRLFAFGNIVWDDNIGGPLGEPMVAVQRVVSWRAPQLGHLTVMSSDDASSELGLSRHEVGIHHLKLYACILRGGDVGIWRRDGCGRCSWERRRSRYCRRWLGKNAVG